MRCKELIRRLSDYLDGDLDAAVAQAVERHLEHCDDCRLVVDTTRKTISVYCATDPVPLPPEVEGRLRDAFFKRIGSKP